MNNRYILRRNSPIKYRCKLDKRAVITLGCVLALGFLTVAPSSIESNNS